MLDLIKSCNDADFSQLYHFDVAGKQVGYVRPQLAETLIQLAPGLLAKTDERSLTVATEGRSPQKITDSIVAMHERLAAQGILPKPVKEFTDVRARLTDAPLFQINRNLIFPLGIKSWGTHIIMTHENGDFVVAKRSNKVFTFRGCYDVPVGGLLPSGKEPWDHVKVEASEEAGLTADLIQPNGEAMVLAYARNVQGQQQEAGYKPAFPFETDGGTNWDEVFYWSTTISDNVILMPRDGEVKSFRRMSPAELVHSLKTEPDAWKTNSGVMFLQVLARDPRHSHHFTTEDISDLERLLIPDPRPLEARGKLAAPPIRNPLQVPLPVGQGGPKPAL